MPSTAPLRLPRLLLALLSLLLVAPLTVLLAAAPASAVAYEAGGEVVDALGDPILGVNVTAYLAPGFTVAASVDATDDSGVYALDLDLGADSYGLRFEGAGFSPTWYGGEVPVVVSMDEDGQLFEDGEPVADNLLASVTLASTTTHEVTGDVETSTGDPLADILVTAHPEGDPDTDVDTATSGPSGGYLLELPLGTYQLEYTDPADAYLPAWYGGAEPGQTVTVQADGTLLADDVPIPSLADVALTAAPVDAEWPIAGQVLDANGDPVDGITVSVTPTGASSDSGTTSTGTIGGEDGRYTVSVLPGTYHVGFAGTGFVSAPYTGDGGDTQATVTVAANGTLSVTPAEDLVGNELNATTLVSVAYPVTGTVAQAAPPGNPLGGITVRVYPVGDHTTPVGETTTENGGDYLVSVPIGTYDLQFVDEVADATDYVATWLGGDVPSPVTVGQSGTISYDGGTVTELPAVLMSEPPADATYDVTGQVLDALGEPIQSLDVTATPTGATPVDQAVTDATGTDPSTFEDGTYHLLLEAGTYEVSVEGGSDFADSTYPGFGEPTATITVQANGVVLVNAVEAVGGLLEPIELTGTATYPLATSVGDGLTALPGITVDVYAEGDTTPGSEVASTSTDGSGDVSIPVTIGSYVLRFSGSSGGTLYDQRWYGAGAAPGTSVQLGQGGALSVDGSPVANLDDVVMTAASVDTTYPLPGSVVDANYEPLPGVTVTAVAVSGGAETVAADSDVDGNVTLEVKPGTYEVSYAKSGYTTGYYLDPEGVLGTEHAQVVVAVGGAVTINGTPLTDDRLDAFVLVSSTTYAVSGTVTDEGATGLAGITVEALVAGESTVVATDESGVGGAYTLDLPVGTYTVQFTDEDGIDPVYAFTSLGGDTPLDVRVATGGAITVNDLTVVSLPAVTMTEVADDVTYDLKGFVYDATTDDYDALDGVTVTVLPVAGTPSGNATSGTTGADTPSSGEPLGDAGVYRVPVKPGKYQLRFSKAGYQTTFLTTFDDLTRPVTVTVAANGVITAPGLDLLGGVIDDVQLLLPAPVLVTAPRLTGKLVVGQTVTTSIGTWSPDVPTIYPGWQDATYIEWFVDGRSADQYSAGYYFQKFQVPLVAATKKLTYRITIEDPHGYRAPVTWTSKPLAVPKAPSTVAGAFKKGKLTVTVKVPGLKKPTGKITVLEGRKKVGAATITAKGKGVVVIKLAKLKPGKHKLTVVYAGTKTVAGSRKVVRIKV